MKTKSLKLNFIMNAILTISRFVFPLISFPYVSRILLPEGTGKVSFAVSLISYFSLFSQLGIPTYGIRACATVRDNKLKLSKIVHELLMINLLTMLATYLLFFLALAFIPQLQEDKILYIVVSMSIFFDAIGMEWLYKGLEQYTYITVRSLVFKAIALISMFLLIHSQSDYIIYAAITVFATSASSILNLINSHKYISFKRIGGYSLKRHLKPVMVFFAMACATTIYTHLDSVMIGFMNTSQDVGYYDVAVKVRNILIALVTSLGAVLLPRSSYFIENNLIKEFYAISKKAINFVFVMAFPITVYFVLFAKECVYVLSGSAYDGSIIPMQIIMPTVLLVGLTNIMGIQMLIPLKKEKIVLYSVVLGAVVDLIINFLLIPQMKSSGAAIGTLIAELAVFIFQYIYLRKEVKSFYKDIKYLKIILSSAVGSILALCTRLLSLNSFLTLALSAVLFFGTYALLLCILKEPLVSEVKNTGLDKIKKLIKRA